MQEPQQGTGTKLVSAGLLHLSSLVTFLRSHSARGDSDGGPCPKGPDELLSFCRMPHLPLNEDCPNQDPEKRV
jgi:hypothetical protein